MPECLNCNQEWKKGDEFCSNCSQSTVIQKVTAHNLFNDFLYYFFGLQKKLYATIIDHFIPARFAQNFIAGKRVRYYTPVQVFVLSLLTFFTLIFVVHDDSLEFIAEVSDFQERQTWQDNTLNKIDSLTSILDVNPWYIEIVKKELFYKVEDEHRSFTLLGKEVQYDDLFKFNADELTEHYELEEGFEELFFVQFQKFIQSPSKSLRYILGNGVWTIIVMILLMSIFFHFLFYRTLFNYGEHLLFLITGMTRFNFASSIFLLIYWYRGNGYLLLLPFALAGIYLLLEIKIFYGQGYLRSFLKWIAAMTMFLIILTTAFYAINLISFLFL